jgi:hypothetical protein
MTTAIVNRVEWARLEGQRPRHAGCNARLDNHGIIVRPVIARLTTNDGATGCIRSLIALPARRLWANPSIFRCGI